MLAKTTTTTTTTTTTNATSDLQSSNNAAAERAIEKIMTMLPTPLLQQLNAMPSSAVQALVASQYDALSTRLRADDADVALPSIDAITSYIANHHHAKQTTSSSSSWGAAAKPSEDARGVLCVAAEAIAGIR